MTTTNPYPVTALYPRVQLPSGLVRAFLVAMQPREARHLVPVMLWRAGVKVPARRILREALDASGNAAMPWRDYRWHVSELTSILEGQHKELAPRLLALWHDKGLTWRTKLAVVCEVYRAHLAPFQAAQA